MTAAQPLVSLLTIDEYAALGETDNGYTELLEGRLLVSPSPAAKHNYAALALAMQLVPQLPEHLDVLPDLDIDLQLSPPGQPGWSRRPDLIISQRAARARVDAEGGLIRASEVLVVIEIVSPGSRRTDHVTKRYEYADAGIEHYWIVDLDPPVSLLAHHLAGDFGYADCTAATGVFTTTTPFPIRVELDRLR